MLIKVKFRETTVLNEDKEQHGNDFPTLACETLSVYKTGKGPQILAMVMRCYALNLNVIPYFSTEPETSKPSGLRAQLCFHSNHMRLINTCTALLLPDKGPGQVCIV